MEALGQILERNPIIAALRGTEHLPAALESDCEVLFLLSTGILEIGSLVEQIHGSGKSVYVHMDLMEGLRRDRAALGFLRSVAKVDGIITTHSSIVRMTREEGLPCIQRLFLIDNLSVRTGVQSVLQTKPGAVEVMPGIVPAVTKQLCDKLSLPVITGGLVNTKEDVIASLAAGAVGVSTSNPSLWNI